MSTIADDLISLKNNIYVIGIVTVGSLGLAIFDFIKEKKMEADIESNTINIKKHAKAIKLLRTNNNTPVQKSKTPKVIKTKARYVRPSYVQPQQYVPQQYVPQQYVPQQYVTPPSFEENMPSEPQQYVAPPSFEENMPSEPQSDETPGEQQSDETPGEQQSDKISGEQPSDETPGKQQTGVIYNRRVKYLKYKEKYLKLKSLINI